MKKRTMKLLVCLTVLVLAGTVFAVPAFAAGDVASAIEQTWKAAQTQIKNVVNNVVFPVVDIPLLPRYIFGRSCRMRKKQTNILLIQSEWISVSV